MTDKAISPLRQRMIEDMTIRKLAPNYRCRGHSGKPNRRDCHHPDHGGSC